MFDVPSSDPKSRVTSTWSIAATELNVGVEYEMVYSRKVKFSSVLFARLLCMRRLNIVRLWEKGEPFIY